ncbi:MAG: DUF917 domain-containing protein [Bacillota bacterium]|nr:DUF917 domain-containing protein [Bacillota bacterium]
MRQLHAQDIEDIAVGAALLGTGGGGDPHVGKLMALQAIEESGPVDLVDVSEVPDEGLIVPLAMMGAPTVLVEKVPNGEEFPRVFEALKNYLGKPVFATMPIEAGGVNSMIPLASAAKLRIPVIDADGMGRAFPELQMVTFHLAGASATPMVMTDEKGNLVLFSTISNHWTEALARSATVVMGGSAMIAIYPLTGRQVKDAAIGGIVTLAQRIGEAIRRSRIESRDPLAAVLEVTGGLRLFKGKIVDVSRKTAGGFVRGEALFEGIDDYRGKTLRLQFQNENLIAVSNGRVLASVPDLITVLDAETAKPVTTETLKYGYRAIVIGIPCNARWRTPKGIETVGPRYFGYDIDYVPIEERVSREWAKGGEPA